MAPLLLELARARRARQFFPREHATPKGAVERAAKLWRTTLTESGRLRLRVEEGGFAVTGGSTVGGPGIAELARDFLARGIATLAIDGAVEARELEPVVEVLALEPGPGGPERLSQQLSEVGARCVRLALDEGPRPPERSEAPTPAEPVTRASAAPGARS